MNKTGKLAIVGDTGSIYAFKTIGAEVFAASDAAGAKTQIMKLVKSGDYAVIFITEQLAEGIADYLEELKNYTYPCIIPIPSASGSTGYGMASIRKDVEKAIGADIFSGGESPQG